MQILVLHGKTDYAAAVHESYIGIVEDGTLLNERDSTEFVMPLLNEIAPSDDDAAKLAQSLWERLSEVLRTHA